MWDLKACRTCLATNSKLEKIDECSKRIYTVVIGLKIANGDGYPNYLCVDCSIQLKKILSFRKRSRRVFFALHEIMITKKQVTLKEIINLNSQKTHLDSTYDLWKPHNVDSNSIASYVSNDTKDNIKNRNLNNNSNCDIKTNGILNKNKNSNFNVKINDTQRKNSIKEQSKDSVTNEVTTFTPDINNEYRHTKTDIKPSNKETEGIKEEKIHGEVIKMKEVEQVLTQEDMLIQNDIKPSYKEKEKIEDEERNGEEIKEKEVEQVLTQEDTLIQNNSISFNYLDKRNLELNEIFEDLKEDKRNDNSRDEEDINDDVIKNKEESRNDVGREEKDVANAEVTEESMKLRNIESHSQNKTDLAKESKETNKLRAIRLPTLSSSKGIHTDVQPRALPAQAYKNYLIVNYIPAPVTIPVKRHLIDDVSLVSKKVKPSVVQDDRLFIIRPRINQSLLVTDAIIENRVTIEENKETTTEGIKEMVDEGEDCQQNKRLNLETDENVNETGMNIEENVKLVSEKQDCQQIKELPLSMSVKFKEKDESKEMMHEEYIEVVKKDRQQVEKLKLGPVVNVEEAGVNLEVSEEMMVQKQDCQPDVANLESKACGASHEEGVYKCTFCREKFHSAKNYVGHVLDHHTRKPYCCALCPSRYRHSFECKNHILKAHAPESPYRCARCAQQFARIDSLTAHSMIKHGVDPAALDLFKADHLSGKLFVYPHMKIDVRWISKDILQKIDLEVHDYLDECCQVVKDYRNYVTFGNKGRTQKKSKRKAGGKTSINGINGEDAASKNMLINEESKNELGNVELTVEENVENLFKEHINTTNGRSIEVNVNEMETVLEESNTSNNRILNNGESISDLNLDKNIDDRTQINMLEEQMEAVKYIINERDEIERSLNKIDIENDVATDERFINLDNIKENILEERSRFSNGEGFGTKIATYVQNANIDDEDTENNTMQTVSGGNVDEQTSTNINNDNNLNHIDKYNEKNVEQNKNNEKPKRNKIKIVKEEIIFYGHSKILKDEDSKKNFRRVKRNDVDETIIMSQNMNVMNDHILIKENTQGNVYDENINEKTESWKFDNGGHEESEKDIFEERGSHSKKIFIKNDDLLLNIKLTSKESENIFEEHLDKDDDGEDNLKQNGEETEINYIEIGSEVTIGINDDPMLINLQHENSMDQIEETDKKTISDNTEENTKKHEQSLLKEPLETDNDKHGNNDANIVGEEIIIEKRANDLNYVKDMERKNEDIFKECLEAEYGINPYDGKTSASVKATPCECHDENTDDSYEGTLFEEQVNNQEIDNEGETDNKANEISFEDDNNAGSFNEETDEKPETSFEEEESDNNEVDEEGNKDAVNGADVSDEVIFVKVNGVNYEVIERDGEQCVLIDGVLYRIEHTE